jgi:hypothetical protein
MGCTSSREEAHSLTCVSPSPSKIPYGEFSPVRLQTNFQAKDLRDNHTSLSAVHIRLRSSLIPWLSVEPGPMCQILELFVATVLPHQVCPCVRISPIGRARSQPPHVRPEALGSPGGYAVLPGRCLLWPHPRLWDGDGAGPAFVRPRKTAQGGHPELPQFTPPDCTAMPPPLPRWPREVRLVVASLAALAFASGVRARHPH